MNVEILLSLLSGAASAIAGGVVASQVIQKVGRRLLGRKEPEPEKTYSERLHQLTETLRASSAEVDSVLLELSQVAKERQDAAATLEAQLSALQVKEQSLQERVQALERVPLPVAEYFASLTAAGEKRSARRDYLLFGSGVAVSTILSIIFFLIQG